MTKINPFYFILSAGIAACLFLPHVKYDIYNGGFFNHRNLVRENVTENGLSFIFSYVPFFAAIGTALLANLYRSLGTAIAGLVIMTLTLLYMPFEGFALTFEIFGPRKNLTVQLGFWLKIIFVLGYIVFMIVEIRNRVKERKQERSIQSSQPDLLDDF